MVRKVKKRKSNLQVEPPKSDGEGSFGVLEGRDGVGVGEELLSVDANDAAPDGDALGGGLTIFSDADHDRHWVQAAPLLKPRPELSLDKGNVKLEVAAWLRVQHSLGGHARRLVLRAVPLLRRLDLGDVLALGRGVAPREAQICRRSQN